MQLEFWQCKHGLHVLQHGLHVLQLHASLTRCMAVVKSKVFLSGPVSLEPPFLCHLHQVCHNYADLCIPLCAELLASSALSDDSDDGQPFKRIHAQRAAEQQRQQQQQSHGDRQHGSRPAHVASPLKPLVTRRFVTIAAISITCDVKIAACRLCRRHARTSSLVDTLQTNPYSPAARTYTMAILCCSRERSKTAATRPGVLGATSLELGTVEALADLKGVAQGIAQAAHTEPTPLDRLATTADVTQRQSG